MLWFINNINELKKQLAEAQEIIAAQATAIADLQTRVTDLEDSGLGTV